MNHFLAAKGNEIEGWLSADDSHHALRVLRLKTGDSISISYGDGWVYTAALANEDKRNLHFKVKEKRRYQSPSLLSIAMAPTKSNDRFEWFLEKATELGIARIIPIICEHSERKVYKRERGMRIIEAAFKQSHKGRLPDLSEAISFKSLLEQEPAKNAYLASLISEPKTKLHELHFQEAHLLLVGPEGDFSESELKLAKSKGFKHLDLGNEVLRTETAGVHICSVWNYENGRAK